MRTYTNEAGGNGPEWSSVTLDPSQTGWKGGAARFQTTGGRSVWLTGAQVDDLIAQLCALRGIDSPTKAGSTRMATVLRPVAVPRVERLRGLRSHRRFEDLLLWISDGQYGREAGTVCGWWVDEDAPTPHVGDKDSRGATVNGWKAGPCAPAFDLDQSNPAYLRALASLYERPTETRMIEETTEVRVPVEGVSGDDFTAGGF